MIGQSLYAIIDLVLRLATLLFLLRFLLQAADADRFNPLSQAVVKGSDPFAQPLRKLLPNLGRWDLASLLLAATLEAHRRIVPSLRNLPYSVNTV